MQLGELQLEMVNPCAICEHYTLLAAMNPCPCSYYGDPIKECNCLSAMVTRYQKRISGSILDRFDIHIEVPRVEYEKLSDERLGEPSINIQCRVEAARDIQQEQFQKTTPFESNSHLAVTCNFDMRTAMSQMQLSARAYHRLLKLSLTIVDLAGSDAITPTWQKRCNTDQS